MSLCPMHAYIHALDCVNATSFAGILVQQFCLEKDTNSKTIPEHDTVMLTKETALTKKFQNKAEKTLSQSNSKVAPKLQSKSIFNILLY